VPTTDATRKFVKDLKRRFHNTPPWGWGEFRASEGFVIIPVVPQRFRQVWGFAAELAQENGLALFDPQADLLVQPTSRRATAGE
jgi:hypothetical protein